MPPKYISLVDIYNQRPDLQTAFKQGTTQGTQGNTQLNNWWNQYGTKEYAGYNLVQPGDARITPVNAPQTPQMPSLSGNPTSPQPMQPGAPTQPTMPIAPTAPQLPQAPSYDYTGQLPQLQQQYTANAGFSPAELQAQKELDNVLNSRDLGLAQIKNTPQPMQFITGQSAALQESASLQTQPLIQRANLLQAQRLAALDASKFAYDAEKDRLEQANKAKEAQYNTAYQQAQDQYGYAKDQYNTQYGEYQDKLSALQPSKGIEINGSLINPITGEVMYQTPQEQGTQKQDIRSTQGGLYDVNTNQWVVPPKASTGGSGGGGGGTTIINSSDGQIKLTADDKSKITGLGLSNVPLELQNTILTTLNQKAQNDFARAYKSILQLSRVKFPGNFFFGKTIDPIAFFDQWNQQQAQKELEDEDLFT